MFASLGSTIATTTSGPHPYSTILREASPSIHSCGRSQRCWSMTGAICSTKTVSSCRANSSRLSNEIQFNLPATISIKWSCFAASNDTSSEMLHAEEYYSCGITFGIMMRNSLVRPNMSPCILYYPHHYCLWHSSRLRGRKI